MADTENSNFGDILKNAVSDPRFSQIFSTLKEKVDSGELDLSGIKEEMASFGSDSAETVNNDSAIASEKKPDVVGGGSEKKMPDLDALSKIPELMKIVGPLAGASSKSSNGEKKKHGHSEMEKHRRLLSALTPYLSNEKKGAVENIIKISEVTDIFEGMMGKGK